MAKRGKIKETKETIEEIQRPVRYRHYKYLFLIVCEDEGTEPYYFEKFRKMFEDLIPKDTLYLRTKGTGRNSLGVVKAAIEEKSSLAIEADREVDEVWVVFDKDDLDKSEGNTRNFEQAFDVASENNIKLAYSNECFELWLLMHFEKIDPETIERKVIYSRIEETIKNNFDPDFVYEHGKKKVVDIVWEKGDRDQAIANADFLNEYHSKKGTPHIKANPNTYVNLLVKSLQEWYNYYSYE